MRSQLAVRLGVQVPQIVHLPPDVASLAAAEEAIELADAYGLADGHPLDESQRIVLRAGLGERADGSWAASQVADFKGRQAGGKSTTIEARELAGLLLFGEQLIIHTAHEFPTANESFLHLVEVFENWDDLSAKVLRVLYGAGTQSITLRTGQRILYKARTGGSARGFRKAALVVYDEAQQLQSEHVAASGPARLSHPNPQGWYAGSGGLTTSKMAWRMRRRALSGAAGRLAYCENTAEEVSLDADGRVVSVAPDPTDRDGWAKANPGLGRWVTEEAMAGLFDELGPELHARECGCVWEPDSSDEAITALPGWAECKSPRSGPLAPFAFGLEVSHDRAWAAFGVAAHSGLGGTHLEITSDDDGYDYRPGTGWVVARAKALVGQWGGVVAVAKGSPAAGLVPDLTAAGVPVLEVSEMAAACGLLFDAVTNRDVHHLGQPALDVAVAKACRRFTTDTWVWDRRRSQGDISPLGAVTLAKWALDHLPGVSSFVDLADYLD